MCSGCPIRNADNWSPRSSRLRMAPSSTKPHCGTGSRPSCRLTRSRNGLPPCRVRIFPCSPAARLTSPRCRRCSMPDTIDHLVRIRAQQYGEKPMVIDTETRVSYAELEESTRALAAAFLDGGVGKGTRVGLIMPNRVQWVQIAVALTRIGAVLVPVSTLLQAPEVGAHRRAASVQALITVDEFRGHRYLEDLARVADPPELPALR